jgi:hypothetical protein
LRESLLLGLCGIWQRICIGGLGRWWWDLGDDVLDVKWEGREHAGLVEKRGVGQGAGRRETFWARRCQGL